MLTRKDKILKLIVESFIKSAQPVGSQTLINEYHVDCSSATIRSEMNYLEKEGFLEKTHTSSGRVPSSKGYKYYIDNLREKSVDEEIKYQIQNVLSAKIQSVEDVIKESCEILSHMTNLASIVLGSDVVEDKLISIQLIPLSERTATAVFVTDQGYVENKTFVVNEKINAKDAESCMKILNDRLKGTAISELVSKMETIKPLINDYIIDHDVIYQAIMEAFMKFAADRLRLYGKDELYGQPEFANDAQKLKRVLELLDNPDEFKRTIDEKNVDNHLVQVHIGNDENDDVSIVSAKINVPGCKDGNIALVGPTRMDYDKVVTALEYVCQELERYFAKKGGEKSWKKKKINSKTTKTATKK